VTGRFFGGCVARRASRAYAGTGTGTCTRTGSRAARLEKLHVVCDDLGHAPLLAVLTLPGACLDAALDENERAFARVLRDCLGKISLADRVRDDVVVVGELLALAVGAGGPAIRRDRKAGDRGAARRVAHLGVLREPADEQCFVEVRHLPFLPIPG